MSLARIAKAGGDGRLLLPDGCESAEDIPWDLANAISHAMTILRWQENILSEEMPPDWMWPFDDFLEDHFDRIEEQRKNKYAGGSTDDTDNSGWMRNELSPR